MHIKIFVPLGVLLLCGLVLSGCTQKKVDTESPSLEAGPAVVVTPEELVEPVPAFNYTLEAVLHDVSNGKSSGEVKAGFDGNYRVEAIFKNLPEPQNGDFYEGWVVRRGANLSVISSGVAVKTDSGYVNTFTSNQDLLDHDFYVLTLEPDDGDPAPAAHILEGVLE